MEKNKPRICVIGNDGIGWSIDNDKKNVINLLSRTRFFEVTGSMLRADVLYSVWYDILERPHVLYPLKALKAIRGTKLMATVTNRIENTPEKILRLRDVIDTWIAPSKRTFDYLVSKGVHAIHIPFLVDKAVFKNLNIDRETIANLLGIDFRKISGKTIIGSFQRDSLGSDLSKPKWQKNPDLLIEILRNLPKDRYILLLAGPRRHYLIRRCEELSIPYLFIGDESFIRNQRDDIIKNNLALEKINLLYNLSDVCIVTSKSEGGPKAILECALTETLIFSTDVGLVKDILHSNLIFSENDPGEVIDKLRMFMSGNERYADEIRYNSDSVATALDDDKIIETIRNALYEN